MQEIISLLQDRQFQTAFYNPPRKFSGRVFVLFRKVVLVLILNKTGAWIVCKEPKMIRKTKRLRKIVCKDIKSCKKTQSSEKTVYKSN